MSRFDIFVSYASPNFDSATGLVGTLESSGINCWIAPRNISVGRDYGEEIINGISESCLFLVVFSAEADRSQHVLREVDRAIGFDKVIVPIKIDISKPSGGMDYRLCTVQWIEGLEFPVSKKIIEDILNVLSAAKRRQQPLGTPEYIILNVCSRCGAQYGEHDPSGCSFHPVPPEVVGNTGPRRDYADIWRFPCCGQKYVGTFRGGERGHGLWDREPPKSPGCTQGRHMPTYVFG